MQKLTRYMDIFAFHLLWKTFEWKITILSPFFIKFATFVNFYKFHFFH